MKKICLIVPSLGQGGAEKVALNLLNNLPLKKFDLNVIIIYKNKGEYFKNLRKNVNCVFLNKSKIRNSIFSLYRELKKMKPEIVLVFSFDLAILIGVFLRYFFKNIYFINRQLNILGQINFSILQFFFTKIAYKNFDKIITQSKDMTEDLIQNIDININKIIEINNPIDYKNIYDLSIKYFPKEFDKKNKNLLCVGRLEPQKGFDLVINIMRLFKDKNIKLYILGEGNQKEALEKLIEIHKLTDRVFLLGRKENPYVYMKNADLFILSSRYEGFPNALLEANSCGLYAICNDSFGGINEIIIDNINGNIVNFKNECLTQKIIEQKLKENKDKNQIINSVLKRYEIDIIIKKYIYLFDTIGN